MGRMAATTVALWATPDQAELGSQIATGAGLTIVRAGSPIKGQSGALASVLRVDPLDDLRSALAERIADVVLMLSAGDLGTDPDRPDAELVAGAVARGTRVFSIEPIPGASLLLERGGWLEPAHAMPVEACRWIPSGRHSFGWRQVPDMMESFGRVRSMNIESLGASAAGTLGARLMGSIELALWMMGMPESVDAAYVGPAAATVHVIPGESLRELRGTMSANLRYADGRSASILASNEAGLWRRGATLIGPGGSLRVSDDGLEWHRPDGTLEDRSRPKVERPWPLATHEVIAESITRTLDPTITDPPRSDATRLLIAAQTALLSARTGQTESIETIKNMSGVDQA